MNFILAVPVRVYQFLSSAFAPSSKYYPSCSNYALTAIRRHGVKGLTMATWRILRCNPWSLGGVDYVDEHLDCAEAVQAKKKKPVGVK